MLHVSPESLEFRALPGRDSADPFPGLPDAEFSVRQVRLRPDGPRRPHRHPHSVEVVHVLAGTGTAWVEGERTRVGPGDTFLVPAGAAHATLPDPGIDLEVLCFFPRGDLGSNLEELDGPELGSPPV
ncbi:MAG: cupin domain-containing protein [Actinobacteria bacterium]|jgi:quercetin dioxygenase-like cupin family protein|nr:cupin domain-containing protein [Actinomycetota bacterium]